MVVVVVFACGGYLQFGDGGGLMGLCKIFLLVLCVFFFKFWFFFGYVVVIFYVVGFHEENIE